MKTIVSTQKGAITHKDMTIHANAKLRSVHSRRP